MTAAAKRTAKMMDGEEDCRESVQGILRALQGCVGKLQQPEDAVNLSINWEKIHYPQPALLSSVLHQHICELQIDRRILAFIERKQAEINENNVREFCNVIDCNQENSCARTDAVFTPFPGSKSHIKVSRVVNAYGPQTRSDGSSSSSRSLSHPRDCGNHAVEERLQNIEYHLQLNPGGPVPKDVYQRIKKLEDRILELEGISPEYFQSMEMSNKRRKAQSTQNYSLLELDQKINALRQTLYKKAKVESVGKM
ncbi:hypothetical protein GDO81_015130 [Engystomops pustulosus]|uniref:MAP3K12-binding inhibitory protein 1 n=1 Tax=Engystomops pustulosus TaxID=76066 RepID=A0AAV7AL91_ENGPU|nr:hypothetical protein GDO81_015130 [Engystomops pustulosus]